MRSHKLLISFIAFMLLFSSCTKYLDAKPDRKMVVPSTITDLQALLDYYPNTIAAEVKTGEICSDDFYVTYNDWASTFFESERRAYTWEKDYVHEQTFNDWSKTYQMVYYANLVLEGLEKISDQNNSEYKNIKGQAHFLRAKAYLHAAWHWCKAYDKTTAAADLGLPLRYNTNFNEPASRSSVAATYNQVLEDLNHAIRLLPVSPLHVTRSSQTAAYGLMARTLLSMREYPRAGLYADSALNIFNHLIDYNSLNPSAAFPLQRFNSEVIYDCYFAIPSIMNGGRAKIDTVLHASYQTNDLRRTLFFQAGANATYSFKGSYNGSSNLFSGLSTAELYLIKAEALARQDNVTSAMNTLNRLLIKRWKTGTFVPYTAATPSEALDIILLERRKELIFRGLRWIDLKRLNKEGRQITLKRILNNQVYVLPPNDNRYQLSIPEEIIELSGIQQNP